MLYQFQKVLHQQTVSTVLPGNREVRRGALARQVERTRVEASQDHKIMYVAPTLISKRGSPVSRKTSLIVLWQLESALGVP